MPHIAKQTAAHIPSMQTKPGRDLGKGSSPATPQAAASRDAPQSPKAGGGGASKSSGGGAGRSGGGGGRSGGGPGRK